MIRCDKCNASSVIFQRYSGMHLCRDHFDKDVHRKVREVLRETRIFGQGAKLAIALDGRKNSSAMLCILRRLFFERRDIEIVVVLVDEGISGYRTEALVHARNLAERLQVPYITRNFKDAFQITTDEIASNDRSRAPCTFCGSMRKALLNSTALELEAKAIASGHTLDREAQTIMINFLREDIGNVLELQPQCPQPEKILVIKPLRRVPEREVALYAAIHGLSPSDSCCCPYLGDPLRLEVKKNLEEFEAKHPGTKYSLLRSLERIVQLKP